jgi:hypothetical protein
MKYFLILLLFFSCKKETDITIQFIDDFYTSESYNIEDLNDYMVVKYIKEYQSLPDDKKDIHNEYIKDIIDYTRKKIIEEGMVYQILPISKMDEDILKGQKFEYKGQGEVYFLLTKNGKNILSFIIVENNKILSFCPDIYRTDKNKIVPYFFFNEI